jgi:hypothetical protein
MATRFVPNPAFFQEMLTSPGVQEALRPVGERVLSAAVAGAPMASGDYAASLQLVVERHGKRAAAHVFSDDPAGNLIERRHHTLRNALGSA